MARKKAIIPTVGGSHVHLMHGTVYKHKKKVKAKLIPALRSPTKPRKTARPTMGANSKGTTLDDAFGDIEMPRFNRTGEKPMKSKSMTPDDYMAEWVPKQGIYLEELLSLEAPPHGRSCTKCLSSGSSQGLWRCKDCIGLPVYCDACCRDTHLRDPFHRVERYQGGHFSPSWLWVCGVYVNLCPSNCCGADSDKQSDTETEEDEVDEAESMIDGVSFEYKPKGRYLNGMKVIVVVHLNGVHHLPFRFCSCLDSPTHDIQLLRYGLYPSTSKDVRTAFTTSLLDNYLLDMVECFTSTHHYYAKIKRLTNEPFPNAVPVSITIPVPTLTSILAKSVGNRQMNMDYAFSQALKLTNTDEIQRVILAYDINCQYSKRFYERFAEGSKLSIPEQMQLLFAIGLFHVHGHQETCNHRYSLNYIEGAGMSSGEILESLWAIVNEVARSTSTMTLAARHEMLDAVFGDINWKKLINLVPTICRNWNNARLQLLRASEDFELLDETASPAQRSQWSRQLKEAHRNRLDDVSSMDMLGGKFTKPPTMAKTQSELMEKEQVSNKDVGVTTWLALGLKIQEMQLTLKSQIRFYGNNPSDNQELDVAKKREQITVDINEFYASASTLFPEIDFDSLRCNQAPEEDDITLDDDEEPSEEGENPYSLDANRIEDVRIPLPSSFDELPSAGMGKAARKELKLRVSQADEALEGVRSEIGHKSFLYRSNVRLAQGKKQKTRGYAAVKNVDRQLRHHIKVYNQARWAMLRLGANDNLQLRYRPIQRGDTRVITAVYQPNARGERNKALSWIWNLNVEGDSRNSAYMEELYRVNWLRAKSRADRWKEEFTLLSAEMEWVCNFFSFKEEECQAWEILQRDKPGHVAYAKRQGNMWKEMGIQAKKAFDRVRESCA